MGSLLVCLAVRKGGWRAFAYISFIGIVVTKGIISFSPKLGIGLSFVLSENRFWNQGQLFCFQGSYTVLNS